MDRADKALVYWLRRVCRRWRKKSPKVWYQTNQSRLTKSKRQSGVRWLLQNMGRVGNRSEETKVEYVLAINGRAVQQVPSSGGMMGQTGTWSNCPNVPAAFCLSRVWHLHSPKQILYPCAECVFLTSANGCLLCAIYIQELSDEYSRLEHILSLLWGKLARSWPVNSCLTDLLPTAMNGILSGLCHLLAFSLFFLHLQRCLYITCQHLREECEWQWWREAAMAGERRKDGERSRQGLGDPLGNLKPSPLSSVSRSDDLSKITTSIVHHSLSLSLTLSRLLHLSHVTIAPLFISGANTWNERSRRDANTTAVFHSMSSSPRCVFQSECLETSSLSLRAATATHLVPNAVIHLSIYLNRLSWPLPFARERSDGVCYSDHSAGLPEVHQGEGESWTESVPGPRQEPALQHPFG